MQRRLVSERGRSRAGAPSIVLALATVVLAGQSIALAREPLPSTTTTSISTSPSGSGAGAWPGRSSPSGPTGSAPIGPAGTVGPACESAPDRVLLRYAPSTGVQTRVSAMAKVRATRLKTWRLTPGIELLRISLPLADALATLRAQRNVEWVEPDCIVHLAQTPNDPGLTDQWGLVNTGDLGGTPGADIGASGGWDIRTDAGSVPVAVIDSGMQLNHPDLAANLWTNPGEAGAKATNGLDDDHNGYVDDVHGWDFVNNDPNPSDDNGHGTHVAGTIGARGNNGTGVSGVAWTVKLMPLKAFDANGNGYTSTIVGALDYAVANGARVSNNSYSGPSFERAESDAFVAAGAAGHLAIAAAGNDAVDNDEQPHYPAAFRLDSVVSVAATDRNDELASFSDYGVVNVDVAAPGESILSTWLNSGYAYLGGTSMAAPHVTGVAALLAAQHPTWTGLQIRDRILGTTRAVAALDGKAWTGGVVNAATALSNAPTVPPAPLPGPTPQTFAPAIVASPKPAPVAAPVPPAFAEPDVIESSPVDTGTSAKIVVDASGQPNIAYTRNSSGVSLLTLDGAWSERPLTSAFDEVAWLDLALDGNGVPTAAVQRAWTDATAYSDPGILLAGAQDPTPAVTRLTAACPDLDTCFWDWNPALAYDGSGSAHVAFTRTVAWDQNAVFAPAGSAPSVAGTGLFYATNASGAWVVRRLTTDPVDGPSAIAVETDGTVHITVRRTDGPRSGLHHFTNEGGVWTKTQLSDHVEDLWSSVGVTSGGTVHVAVARPGFGIYDIVRQAGGAWNAPLLVHDGEATAPDLTVDGAGHVHLVFGLVDGFNTVAGVGYATNATGSWVEKPVAGGQAHSASIAVDASGRAHVAYQRATSAPLGIWYATNVTGSFVSTIARASSSEGGHGNTYAYAVDAGGHQHVALASRYGDTSAGLYYGSDLTGTWVVTKVSSAWPTSVSMAIDTNGRPHVAFTQQINALTNQVLPTGQWRVGYATNASGTWVVDTASSGASFGGSAAIALDAANQPILVYPDEPTTHLVRARRVGGTWTKDTIFSGASNIRDPSVTLDAGGVLHVAVSAALPGDPGLRIEYIRGTTGSWTAQAVTGGTVYRFSPTIGRAADGTTWISHWTDDGQIWVHRRPASGTWTGTLLDTALGASWPWLAIDRSGKVNVIWAIGAFYGSSGCAIPECAAGPGLRRAVLDGGGWTTTKLSPFWQDALPILAAGGDGSLRVAFLRSGAGLRSLELLAGPPAATLRLQAGSDTGLSTTDRLTNATSLTFEVDFNRAVTGLTGSDLTVTGTATGCVVGAPVGTGAEYDVTLTGCAAGTVVLALAAGSVTDGSAVNGPAAKTSAPTVVVDRTAPTAGPPTATLHAGFPLSGMSLPVRLTWTAADAGGAGVGRFEVARSVNGSASWTTLATGLASAALDLPTGSAGTVRYRVRTSDKAGNLGAWTMGPILTPRLSQQTSTALTFGGTWATATSSSYSGGSARHASKAGASATYAFTGRSIALVTTRAPSRGKLKVYVDGTYVGTVDLNAAVRYQVLVWQRTWSTVGTHKVKFVVAGTVGRPRVDLDAVAVLR